MISDGTMTQWQLGNIEASSELGNLPFNVQDRASYEKGPFHFIDTCGQETHAAAYQRIITIQDPEGATLEDKYPATISIQREILPGKGGLTGILFGNDLYGVRYEATLRGPALETLAEYFPGISELYIYANAISKSAPSEDNAPDEDLQTLSMIGKTPDGKLRIIQNIPAANVYKVMMGITQYLHKNTYQKLLSTAKDDPRLLTVIRDINQFAAIVLSIGTELRERGRKRVNEWIRLDTTTVNGAQAY